MTEPFVDYYALLGITRSASPKEIEQAVKRGIRTWSKQTARPELDKRQRLWVQLLGQRSLADQTSFMTRRDPGGGYR